MTEPKPRIRVVAAEIESDGRYLITQRNPHAVLPMLWEFPGGKVEPGEEDDVALKRELDERLGVDIRVRRLCLSIEKEYASYIVDFIVYECELLSQNLTIKNCHDYQWVTPEQINDYDFPSADQETIDHLLGLK